MKLDFRYFIGAIPGFLLALLIIPIHSKLDIPLPDFIKIVISALGSLALIFALLTYLFNIKKFNSEGEDKKSDKYLNEAMKALDRAFTIFTDSNINTSPPRPDRLNWLTTARMIESYKKLKLNVTSMEHRYVLQEHEEYWRHKFYLALGSDEMLTPAYFAKPRKEMYCDSDFANLDLTSLAVIYNFTEWKSDHEDPLNSVDAAKMLSYGTILSRHHGLMTYVKLFKNISQEISKHKMSDPNPLTGTIQSLNIAMEAQEMESPEAPQSGAEARKPP